jgi:SAM-dependent methyltransferase
MANTCPACGAAGMRRWRAATPSDPQLAGRELFELERCARCGSAATVGDARDHAALYEGGTYAEARGPVGALLEPLRRLADRDRMRFVRGLSPGARVLEIGAGDGRFVAIMRGAGLDAWGVDPSPAACAAARRHGVRVENVSVADAELEPRTQDAVILWHALEHLDEPASVLGRIASWLRPGGGLVVAVPNLAGLQSRIGGDRWFHQDVPRHRTHFTPGGVAALLERTGFRLGRIRQLLVEQNPLGMWQTLLNRLTAERDFAFRLIKRDLSRVDRATRVRDLLITGLTGPVAVPVAIALELGAGLTGRGGSMVAEGRLAT